MWPISNLSPFFFCKHKSGQKKTKKVSPQQNRKVSAIWVFPKIGVPQNGWFIMDNPIKMDDLGVSLFLETSILGGPRSPLYTFHYPLFGKRPKNPGEPNGRATLTRETPRNHQRFRRRHGRLNLPWQKKQRKPTHGIVFGLTHFKWLAFEKKMGGWNECFRLSFKLSFNISG